MNGIAKGVLGGALVGAIALHGNTWMDARASAEEMPCAVTYDAFGKGFMEQYCVRCHVSTKTSKFARAGAPLGKDYDVMDTIYKDKAEILKLAADQKKMPPDDPKPSADERAKLKTWLECEGR
jgi:uncharacterized membrane protein